MEFFPTEKELEVAAILAGLSRKILFPVINTHWSRKRKRSSSAPSSSTSFASPQPVAVVMPPLNKASREERKICVGGVSSRIAAETSDNVRREDTSQLLSTISKQKAALADGMEAAMKFYDQLKVYQLKLEKNELFKGINQRMVAVERFCDQIKVNKLQLEKEERKLKQRLVEEERALKQRQREEEQNHTAITNDNRQSQSRPLLDLNLPPLQE